MASIASLGWRVSPQRCSVVHTQDPVSLPQSDKMFAGVPPELFRVHDWRNDVTTLGAVPKEFVEEITEGKYSHEYPVQLNKLVVDGGHDLIISVGQVRLAQLWFPEHFTFSSNFSHMPPWL
eukprot:COSAG05_NODE_1943_length_3799_cov_21.288649_3_plen_121_part_00